jgi:hypothetical protein
MILTMNLALTEGVAERFTGAKRFTALSSWLRHLTTLKLALRQKMVSRNKGTYHSGINFARMA